MQQMKKKKFLYTLYSALFIGICLIPAVTMPLSKNEGTAENRTLSSKPKLKTEDGKINISFFNEFDTYFSEHFGLRQNLVTLDGELRTELLGTSSNSDVIAGRNGWLYYSETADDFMNTNTLTDRAINNICHNLGLMNEYCIANNALFLFTVAPNKNSVYPEYMPYNYIETDAEGNYEKFLRVYNQREDEWMKMMTSSFYNPEQNVNSCWFSFLDLREVLLNEKGSVNIPLYHKTDTHWNNAGALTARNALMNRLGKTECDDFSSAQRSFSYNRSGDLAEMIYPSQKPHEMQIDYGIDFKYQYIGHFKALDDLLINTVCEGADGKLLMYRDSFGEAILPFMAESFESAEFTRAVPYRSTGISDGTADTVILEIVERNLGNLQKYAPMYPAPERVSPETAVNITDCEIYCEDANSYHHIYGLIGESENLTDKTIIYVSAGGKTYEAYSCFEDSLLGMEGRFSDRGFSLYIPKTDTNETIDTNAVTVSIVTTE